VTAEQTAAHHRGSLEAVALPDLLAADGVSGGVVGIGFLELLGDTWDPQRVQGLVEGLKIVSGHDHRCKRHRLHDDNLPDY
jgi:hypothetical protein